MYILIWEVGENSDRVDVRLGACTVCTERVALPKIFIETG